MLIVQKFTEKFRLLAVLGIILVLGFFATSWLSYKASTAAMRQTLIEKNLPLTSDNVYSEIQKDILLPIYISAQMAQNTFLQDWLVSGEQDQTQIAKYLKSVEQNNGMDTAFLLSEKSRIYYTAKGAFAPYLENNAATKWYFRVREMLPDYEINTDTDQVNGKRWTIFINYRIFNRQHQFIGATGVGFTTSKLHDLLADYERKYNSTILLVNETGDVVMASDTRIKVGTSIKVLEGISALAENILRPHVEQQRFFYKLNQQHNTAEVVHINTRYMKELKWYLLVMQGEAVESSKLNHTLWLTALLSLLVTLLVLGLGLLLVKTYHANLERMATTDSLSGLANRQMLNGLLGKVIKESARNPSQGIFSAIIFDIDHFKNVNDTFGHPAGDEVIRQIASKVKSLMRETDVVARWGGEEFFVLLKNCPLNEANMVAEKIRLAVSSIRFEAPLHNTLVTVSLGCTQYQPGEAVETLFARIDSALYTAKNNGRNRIESA